jgi:hypothetical protein
VRALHLLAGTGLVISVLLPTGDIETPWPPYTLNTYAWMEPFVWPFVVLGILFFGAALSISVRRNIAWASFLLGVTSASIFLMTLVVGRKPIYDLWFPDGLGPYGMLQFELEWLVIQYAIMLASVSAGLAGIARNYRKEQAGTPLPESPLSQVPK